MSEKRYYWLKLMDNFFDEKYIKALRSLPQGDSLLIVYLKMQLKSLKTDGIIKYERIMPSPISELALALDEKETVVQLTVEALVRFGVVEVWDNDTFYMSALQNFIGSESKVAERVRRHRALKREESKGISCSDNQTDIALLQCNSSVTKCNTEIRDKSKENRDNIFPPISPEGDKKKKNPSKDEVISYFVEVLHRSEAEATSFWTFNENRCWCVGSTPIRKWRIYAESWKCSEVSTSSALSRSYSKDEFDQLYADMHDFDDIKI